MAEIISKNHAIFARIRGELIAMYRYILIPGAIVLSLAVGVTGFALWDRFHRQFGVTWTLQQAYAGDIAAQRHLASCYMTGCAQAPFDPVFACAWSTIIADETAAQSPLQAKSCSRLSAYGKKWLLKLEAEIRYEMREIKDERTRETGKAEYGST